MELFNPTDSFIKAKAERIKELCGENSLKVVDEIILSTITSESDMEYWQAVRKCFDENEYE